MFGRFKVMASAGPRRGGPGRRAAVTRPVKDWKLSPSKGAGRSSGGVGAPGDGAPSSTGAPGAGTPGNGEFPGADCVEGRALVGDGDGAPGADGVWTVKRRV